MKKIFAAILALLMTLSFAGALAEPAYTAEYATYVHPELGYTFECPAEWYIIDAETIEMIFDAPETAQMFQGVDLESYKQQIELTYMAMFMSPDGIANFNITAQNIGVPFSAEVLVEQLMPSLISQYQQLMPGVQFIEPGCVEEVEGKEYANLMYMWDNGSQLIGAQFAACETGTLYMLTFSCPINDPELFEAYSIEFDHVLATFAPIQ